MALTDPFPADVESWLSESVQHLHRATIYPDGGAAFNVAVDGVMELTYDLDWSPYCQARLTIKTPTERADWSATLDPRLRNRVQLDMGYRREGINHLATMARLGLHRSATPRPGGRTDIYASGLDSMLHEQGSLREQEGTSSYTDRTGVDGYLKSWINRMYEPGPKPAITSTIPGGSWNSGLVAELLHDGGYNWSAVGPVARAAGVRVYDTGLEQWRIDMNPTLATIYAARLKTGKRGTVTSADTSMERRDWANAVEIIWEWPPAPDSPIQQTNRRSGVAEVTSGPLRATTFNRKEYRETREGPVSQAYADAFARGRLRSLMRRGRYRTFTAAACYWLRPGHTILVKFGLGAWDRVLVSRVTFSPLSGSMAVTTIRPEDYETS